MAKLCPTGTIDYPPFIDEVSAYIGKLRDLYNYSMNEKCEKFKRGDRGEFVNILGVKGELVMSWYLHHKGVLHQMTDLLSNRPVVSWDILIGDKRIDVKAIEPTGTDLLVNQRAHQKNKGITTYVFIQFTGEFHARYWIHKYEDVSTWPVKNCKYTDAHFKPITE